VNKTETATGPDIRDLSSQALALGEFPGDKAQAYRIYFAPEVHRNIWAHAGEATVEVCGVLVGRWNRDNSGPFLSIIGSIRGEAAQSKFTEVTFTHETWAKINDEMDKNFSDFQIVGWYHTHPNFGIFLSERDTFIQQHFFSNPGQVAYVVDPVRQIEGVFVWKRGKPTLTPFFWAGNELRLSPGDQASETPPPTEMRHPEFALRARQADAVTKPPTWERVLMYVLVFMIGYLLALNLTGQRSAWEQARLEEGAVARYLVTAGLKPGFTQAVEILGAKIVEARKLAELVSEDARSPTNDEKLRRHRQDRALELQRRLAALQIDLATLQTMYGVSTEEAKRMERFIIDQLKSPAAARLESSEEGKEVEPHRSGTASESNSDATGAANHK
jgi:proteasome lid subunit RPN8/RPN11